MEVIYNAESVTLCLGLVDKRNFKPESHAKTADLDAKKRRAGCKKRAFGDGDESCMGRTLEVRLVKKPNNNRNQQTVFVSLLPDHSSQVSNSSCSTTSV